MKEKFTNPASKNIVLRLGTSCGSFPSPKCLIFLIKYMVPGLRKIWVLCPDVVSNSANQYFKVYTYPSQINIDILGTEFFHRIFCAAGLYVKMSQRKNVSSKFIGIFKHANLERKLGTFIIMYLMRPVPDIRANLTFYESISAK